MGFWTSYNADRQQHTVVGDLRVYRGLYGPQLDNRRDILVWLPPSFWFLRRIQPRLLAR